MRVILVFTLAVVGVGVFFVSSQSPVVPIEDPPAAPLTSSVAPSSEGSRETPSPDDRVRTLLSQQSFESDTELLEGYFAWAGKDEAERARRRILENWSAREDSEFVLRSLLRAVSGDGVPPERDPHWEFARSVLKTLWREQEIFCRGRDRLLASRNVKERRLLATTLLEVAADRDSVSDPDRLALASDAIDLFYRSKSPTLRAEILSRLEPVAGSEVLATMRDSKGAPAESRYSE